MEGIIFLKHVCCNCEENIVFTHEISLIYNLFSHDELVFICDWSIMLVDTQAAHLCTYVCLCKFIFFVYMITCEHTCICTFVYEVKFG